MRPESNALHELNCMATSSGNNIELIEKFQNVKKCAELHFFGAGIVLAALISWRRLQRKRYRKLSSKESNETPLEEIIVKHS